MRAERAKITASMDANAVIHFYRAGFSREPGYVLDGFIDPFVLGEIERNARDVFVQLQADIGRDGNWLKVVNR